MKKLNKKQIIIICTLAFGVPALTVCTIFGVKHVTNRVNEYQQPFKEYYDKKCAEFIEQNKTIKKTQVCFIGDSLTDGCDVKHYYPSFDTLNRGIGGDTTTGVLRRLDISVYAVNPDAVVMLIGTNNYLNMFNDYEDILKEYKTNIPNAKVILCSLTPVASNMGGTIRNTTYATYNVKIKEYANKYSYEFVDIFTPLVNLDEMLIVPEYTIDGIHFTDAGYQIISSIVTNKLNEIL